MPLQSLINWPTKTFPTMCFYKAVSVDWQGLYAPTFGSCWVINVRASSSLNRTVPTVCIKAG